MLLPSDEQQLDLIYFLTRYKVALFGTAAEPIPKFYLYVVPGGCNVGKGANIVITLLHHFFENFSVICHADNCVGQNKN